jgi:hypothetical protein
VLSGYSLEAFDLSKEGRIGMVTAKKMVTVSCLDCENPIELNYRPIRGQIISCPHCNAELEVMNTQPLELEFYYEYEEEEYDEDEEWEPNADSDEDTYWE